MTAYSKALLWSIFCGAAVLFLLFGAIFTLRADRTPAVAFVYDVQGQAPTLADAERAVERTFLDHGFQVRSWEDPEPGTELALVKVEMATKPVPRELFLATVQVQLSTRARGEDSPWRLVYSCAASALGDEANLGRAQAGALADCGRKTAAKLAAKVPRGVRT